jgi:glycosyltransferase involved in cell wall biosynthesis
MREVSLVLPCYNEGPTLHQGLRRILATLQAMGDTFEMILIDDASRDATGAIVDSFASAAGAPVEVVHHRDNQGRGATVRQGLAMSEGSVAGFLDVDLEVGPEYIPMFVETIRSGADVATGLRRYRVGPGDLHRYLLSRGYAHLVGQTLGLPFTDTEAGYKFFSADVAQALVAETSDPGWFWDTEVLATAWRKGLRIVEVPCWYERRRDKRSTVRLIPDTVAYLRALSRYRKEAGQ